MNPTHPTHTPVEPVMDHKGRRRFTVLLTAILLIAGCGSDPTGPPQAPDLEAFKAMARAADCADLRNRLFLIDGSLVFWDKAGQCSDAAYAQSLFGATVDQLICRAQDSIAGPRKGCRIEGFTTLFETMLAHLDEPDLGLGPTHTVEPIPF
jgi:hypothetical protein